MEIAQLEQKNGGILKNLNLFWPPALTPTTLNVLEKERHMKEVVLNESLDNFVIPAEKKIVLDEKALDEQFFEFSGEDEFFYISQNIKFKIKEY